MPTAKKKSAKTLADFRAAHDKNVIIPNKINAALAAMAAEGSESWEYEVDFLRRASVSTTDLAAFRQQFERHIVETTGKSVKRVWFATEKAAKAARG